MLYSYISFLMLLLMCLAFMIPERKDYTLFLRFALWALLLMTAYVFLLPVFFRQGVHAGTARIFRFFRSMLSYAAAFSVICLCGRFPLQQCVYLTGWAYLLREFCFDFGEIIGSYLSLWGGDDPRYFTPLHSATYLAALAGVLVNGHREKRPVPLTERQVRCSVLFSLSSIVLKQFSLLPFFDSRLKQDGFFVFILGWLLAAMLIMHLQSVAEQETSLQVELALQKQLWRQREEQLLGAQENQEIISRKYHDLKHYVAYLKQEYDSDSAQAALRDLEQAVQRFDSTIHTGNDVLDTVLTEKSMECEQKGIILTCIANGALLAGVERVDLYVMFANVLDNAITYLSALPDEDLRTISLAVFQAHRFVKIQVENHCADDLVMEDGLPVTTKMDKTNHGLGLKSVRSISEKYGGYLSVTQEDSVFLLNILLPLTEATSYEEKATD